MEAYLGMSVSYFVFYMSVYIARLHLGSLIQGPLPSNNNGAVFLKEGLRTHRDSFSFN